MRSTSNGNPSTAGRTPGGSRLRGTLDIGTAARLDDMLATLTDLGARFVVLDLGGVDFLDSTGLRTIVPPRTICATSVAG